MDKYNGKIPEDLEHSVGLMTVCEIPKELSTPVAGFDFSKCESGRVDFDKMLSESSLSTGLQSTLMGKAIQELNRMIDAKLSCKLSESDLERQKSIPIPNWKPSPCTIFLCMLTLFSFFPSFTQFIIDLLQVIRRI